MRIQQQPSFRGFKVSSEARPYIKNSLPNVIGSGSDANLTASETTNILIAFKKRMQKLAKALNKKKLDLVLEKQNDKATLALKDKKGNQVAPALALSELEEKQRGKTVDSEIFTIPKSMQDFDAIAAKTHEWLESIFPQLTQKPTSIQISEIYQPKTNLLLQKIVTKSPQEEAPKTLTEAVDKVFG